MATALFFAGISQTYAQYPPTRTVPAANGSDNTQFWSRGGNTPGSNNMLGTLWNSPVYFITGATTPTLRMKLNGPFDANGQYTINGFNRNTNGVNTSGYLLIGQDGPTQTVSSPTALYTNKGAFSMLHLNGERGPYQHVQEDGYRPWMRTGITFTGNGDLSYIGHRYHGEDLTDMVIGWSNDATPNGVNGADNLVFTFLTGATNDFGQEVARFTPSCGNCPINKASFGIGDFAPNSVNGPGLAGYVGATLDVNGDARVRSVTQNNALTQVLVRNPNDQGRLHWRDASTLGGSGTSFGNNCGSTANPLTADRQVPLNNNDMYFTGQSLPANGNTVNIGLNCGVVPTAKLTLLQDVGATVPTGSTGGSFLNRDRASQINLTYVGVAGEANGLQTITRISNVGGDFKASGGTMNYAVRGATTIVTNPNPNNNAINCGGLFSTTGPGGSNNFGVNASSSGGGSNRGVYGNASSTASNTTYNMGGHFGAGGTGTNNTGVYAYSSYPLNPTLSSKSFGVYAISVNGSGDGGTFPANSAIGVFGGTFNYPANASAYAGYFDGNVYVNGPMNGTGFALTSDSLFKTNLDTIAHADSLIARLQPKTFDFIDGSGVHMNFPGGRQYGFIAQQVETVLPDLVSTNVRPALLDTNDTEIYPALRYKTVNYTGFIALLMQNAKEQNEKIAQLSQQLAYLQQVVSGCCSQAQPPKKESFETPAGAVIQTRLQSTDEPSLGQNIPNPFETATRIPVYLPQHIRKAELLFYGHDGKILQNVLISERGNVQVDVNSESLSSGIYSYTLFTDGKPTETRKMIKR